MRVVLVFSEVPKLQAHLKLLRQEYVKLQKHCSDLEKKYQVALASGGQVEEDNFVSRLLRIVADLFDKELYRYFQRSTVKDGIIQDCIRDILISKYQGGYQN